MDETMMYRGQKLQKPFKVKEQIVLEAYLPDQELIEATNLAIFLRRPLLVMGDPGCGKTRLAEAIAFDLYEAKFNDYLFRWNVKSTSKAKDGLYQYNALARLRDAQAKEEKARSAEGYITPGPLGEALKRSSKEKPAVILIDEIDKADLDFPNDLLLELDKGQYEIEETRQIITATHLPIIIITSNGEKELPAAFLRRCLYHYINFPNEEQLKNILLCHFESPREELVNQAVEKFQSIRKQMDTQSTSAEKKVSTSELIDWFRVLNHYDKLKTSGEKTDPIVAQFINELDKLGSQSIPFRQVLLKDYASHIKIMSN